MSSLIHIRRSGTTEPILLTGITLYFNRTLKWFLHSMPILSTAFMVHYKLPRMRLQSFQ